MLKNVILNTGAKLDFEVYKIQKAKELTAKGYGFIKPEDIETEVSKILSSHSNAKSAKSSVNIFSEALRIDINIRATLALQDAINLSTNKQQNLFD